LLRTAGFVVGKGPNGPLNCSKIKAHVQAIHWARHKSNFLLAKHPTMLVCTWTDNRVWRDMPPGDVVGNEKQSKDDALADRSQ